MRISRRKRFVKPDVPHYRVNEQLRLIPEVRIIDENGVHIGVMPTDQALKLALERGYDLVEVSPKETPPIARLLDFGQFKYEKEKEARKQKARSHNVEVKGVRLSLRIGAHDMEVRREQAKRFLEKGDKVQIEIVLRGRERQFTDIAKGVMDKFMELVKNDFDIAVEQPFAKQGGRLTMVIGRK
ncbi:translation initiation factor IF-3 [Candidatus Uhrbacteria bacterium]|nr:translation initiation factor IF-3 [Candidatus Uhrbacteria bacterium]